MSNGNFPGKKKGGRSTIITPRTAQDMLTSGMPRRTREVRETLEQQLPLHIGGEDLVESADRITWTPAEQASALDFKVARLYLRVSTDEQDLQRQERIEEEARRAGYYVAGVYREKASGARADRPELLRMIDDLQPGEVVVAEKIDRLSRLPLAEAEQLVTAIRAKGARLAIPGLVDLSEVTAGTEGMTRIVLEAMQELLLKLALQMARDDYETRRERQRQGVELAQAGVLSRNRRKFRQPINVACPAPGRWGRPNSRVTSRHFDHGNASRTSRPDCSGLDEAD